MDKKPRRSATIFVAGYANLTDEEFATHYIPRLDDYLAEKRNPAIFVLQDEPGAATMVALHLRDKGATAQNVHVYRCQRGGSDGRLATGGNDDAFKGYTVFDINGGPAARDDAILAMVRENHAGNLIWLREADQFSRLSADDVLNSRFSGPRELVRRLKVPGIEQAMAMFDELA